MAKRTQPGPNLFDMLEVEEDRAADACPHRHEDRTFTVWPGESFERLTWTCRACGHVRGRVGGERTNVPQATGSASYQGH